MKFIEMEYPLLRTGSLKPGFKGLERFLDPLHVSLLKSLKEKVPVPIFAKSNELFNGFNQALEKLSISAEIDRSDAQLNCTK